MIKRSRRIALIGLDGIGPRNLETIRKYMPFLNSVMKEYIYKYIRTIPPYTPTIWTSIITGVNPGKHGIYGFFKVERYPDKFVMKKASSYDIMHPTIWELLGINDIKSIVINFPIMYPLKGFLRKNTILVSGWDSPYIEVYPSNLESSYYGLSAPYIIEYFPQGKKETISRIYTNVKKRINAIIKLISEKKHDFFAIVISETDTLQHLFVKNEEDFNNELITSILETIDDFISKIVEYGKYTDIYIVSDHGQKTYQGYYNILYPIIKNKLLKFKIQYDKKFKQYVEKIFNNRFYQSLMLKNNIFRKILFTIPLISIGIKKPKLRMIVKNLLPISYGLYINNNVEQFVESYKEEKINVFISKNLFYGPFIHRLPDIIFDITSFPRDTYYGIELIQRRYILKTIRGHYPGGIFLYDGVYRGNIKQNKIKYIEPWDIGTSILASFLDGVYPTVDGRCIFSDKNECTIINDDKFKKILIYKKISKIEYKRYRRGDNKI